MATSDRLKTPTNHRRPFARGQTSEVRRPNQNQRTTFRNGTIRRRTCDARLADARRDVRDRFRSQSRISSLCLDPIGLHSRVDIVKQMSERQSRLGRRQFDLHRHDGLTQRHFAKI